MKRTLAVVLSLLALAYPFMVFYGLQHGHVQILSLVLLVVFVLRGLLSVSVTQGLSQYALPTAVAGGVLALIAAVFNTGFVLKFYPLLMSFSLGLAFWTSLSADHNMIEGFARRFDKNFTDAAVPYTRNVTVCWIVFFVVNGLVSLATMLYASDFIWSLYNGLISYVLMACLFAGEFLVRTFIVKPRLEAKAL